jgi:ribosomal protein L24E
MMSNRGGYRHGSGRKAGVVSEKSKKKISIRLRPDQILWLKATGNMSKSIEAAIDLLIKNLLLI